MVFYTSHNSKLLYNPDKDFSIPRSELGRFIEQCEDIEIRLKPTNVDITLEVLRPVARHIARNYIKTASVREVIGFIGAYWENN